jgi:hypothetical protein
LKRRRGVVGDGGRLLVFLVGFSGVGNWKSWGWGGGGVHRN